MDLDDDDDIINSSISVILMWPLRVKGRKAHQLMVVFSHMDSVTYILDLSTPNSTHGLSYSCTEGTVSTNDNIVFSIKCLKEIPTIFAKEIRNFSELLLALVLLTHQRHEAWPTWQAEMWICLEQLSETDLNTQDAATLFKCLCQSVAVDEWMMTSKTRSVY